MTRHESYKGRGPKGIRRQRGASGAEVERFLKGLDIKTGEQLPGSNGHVPPNPQQSPRREKPTRGERNRMRAGRNRELAVVKRMLDELGISASRGEVRDVWESAVVLPSGATMYTLPDGATYID